MTRKTKTGSQGRQTAHPKSAVEATITAARNGNGSARRSKGIHAFLALSRHLPPVHALTSAAISSTRRLALTRRTEGLFLRIFSTGTPNNSYLQISCSVYSIYYDALGAEYGHRGSSRPEDQSTNSRTTKSRKTAASSTPSSILVRVLLSIGDPEEDDEPRPRE